MGSDFALHAKLKTDTWRLGESADSVLLLMNNALVPWMILVPKTTVHELHHLEPALRGSIREQVDVISAFLEQELSPDKLNVAAIGNIVSQLHIHIVCRYRNDVFWPGTVWGREERRDYQAEEVERLSALVARDLGHLFHPH